MDTLYEPSVALPVPISLLQDNEEEDDCQNDGVGIKGKSKSSSTKRNACTLCRRRKLRCDGSSPACGTCTRLNHECIYNESRRKSGPRRGYVKGLETRLAQVEGLLKKQEAGEMSSSASPAAQTGNQSSDSLPGTAGFDAAYPMNEQVLRNLEPVLEFIPYQGQIDLLPQMPLDDPTFVALDEGFSWEMIELGVEEPLPPQDTIDELTEIYFSKIHPSTPIIHQYRFLASMNLSTKARPSVALRYAMWTLAASITDKYKSLHSHFYTRARKYAEADEVAGRQRYINLRHAQAFILIATYEFKMMIFPNAWLTTSRATRLTQLMGLNRLDGLGLDVKQSLPIAADWSEKEERRRTFWMAFAMDRYASVGTGWPMIIDERDILTNLPASDEAFAQFNNVPTFSLKDAMDPMSASKLSSFSGSIVVACLSGRIFEHLHRPSPDSDDKHLNGNFWKAHRKMDSVLLNTSLYLPSHLRLPAGSSKPNTIFLNMSLQAAVICLHQAAIFKAEKLELPASVITDSRNRCVAAATEITSIMKRIAHIDLAMLNVYTPFSLYVAARIFAQVSRFNPGDDDAISSVRFLLAALVAVKDSNPLAESYLLQLDLEGTGLAALQENTLAFSDLEKGMACTSIKDNTDESSWVTFVSPLVRIVEQTEDSVSPSATSEHVRADSTITGTDPSGASSYPNNATESTRSSTTEAHIIFSESQGSIDVFAATETWDMDETEMPADLFDSLMDFASNG